MATKKSAGKKGSAKIALLEIEDLETMKVLTEPTRLAILETIMDPCSVTEIAERLDVPRTRLYHHIKLLEGHGLIRIASTRKKGALSEKLYEPTADSYAPGPKLLASENRGERVEALIAGVLDSTREDLRRSLLKHLSEDHHGQPKQTALTRSLTRLKPQEAEQLITELTEVIERYGKLHQPDEASNDTRLYALTWLFYPSSRDRSWRTA